MTAHSVHVLVAFAILTLVGCGMGEVFKRGGKGFLQRDTLAVLFAECVKGTPTEAIVAEPYNRFIDRSEAVSDFDLDGNLKEQLQEIVVNVDDELMQVRNDWIFIEEKLAESGLECDPRVYTIASDLKFGFNGVIAAYRTQANLVAAREWVTLIVRATTNPQGVIVEKLIEAAVSSA